LTTESDPIERLSRALDQTGAIISRITSAQATSATTCSGWDVRGLVNHTVIDVQHFTVSASGGRWEQRDADVIGDDWIGSYRRAADALLTAWRRWSDFDVKVSLPIGEVPASWMVGQQISDLVVHGWDLAKATGQSTDLEPDLGELSLEWGRQNLKPQFRGDPASGASFGAEVPVSEDAPLYDRLAGVFDRRPSWPD
jgi:uncharacterized protein (TIGR03086 family)